jgi:hypothetical protein
MKDIDGVHQVLEVLKPHMEYVEKWRNRMMTLVEF